MKLFLITACLIFFASVFVIAQPPTPPTGPPPPDPPVVPLTGLEYLLIGGGAYGVYRYQKNRKKNNEA